ncbi:adhesion G protein-coupled receptor A3 [Halyomorpha halys]|uniref:adhesion G protein-coupled receptor A3 n=1 Tax=Halyomorpha halys TaxID=286706 RepID=UPI0006D4D00B|nr:adhesion G protein-coupled receptor A3 [Halyomorpha halys]
MEMKLLCSVSNSMKVLVFLSLFTYSSCYVSCPLKCICTESHAKDHSNDHERFKAKCGGGDTVILSIEEIQINHFGNLSDLVTLDLSSNNITVLPYTMFSMQDLQKLHLNKNQIARIDDGAFLNLSSLKRLDLSNNQIRNIGRETFEGLINLEKLKLAQNYIRHIKEGTFDFLVSLKQLDLSLNPLVCDCDLWWIGSWATNFNVKISLNTKCSEPSTLRDQPIKKFQTSAQCVREENSPIIELSPDHDQVVFEGDSLRMDCRSGLGSHESKVVWYWAGLLPETVFTNSVHVENKQFSVVNADSSGIIESSLIIDKLENNHTGEWNCELFSNEGNHSSTVSVIVISNSTKYCKSIVTEDNKGHYVWPKTVAGHVVELPCQAEIGFGLARNNCTLDGEWQNLNTSICSFTSETTRILQQFAQMNLTKARDTIFESAKRLNNYTIENKHLLTDSMDIVFITRTVRKYLEFLNEEKNLGSLLLDLISFLMDLDKELLSSAQLEDKSCSKLLEAIETIIPHTSLQSCKWNMAIDEFKIYRESFLGLTCSWWNSREKKPGDRICHCSKSNKSGVLLTHDKILEASIQIPASLFHQLERQGKTATVKELIVGMFDNTNLFPMTYNSSRVISSPVVGAKLVGLEVDDLTEPVVVMLGGLREGATPVWWSETTGQWAVRPCRPADILHDLLVLHCTSLGYFALASSIHSSSYPRLEQSKSRHSPPGIFVGTFVGSTCLIVAAFTYAVCYSSIQMSGRMKHALANTWLAISFLSLVFSVGIYQTENIRFCQGIGLMLHYLTLCSLFWMAVSINCMHRVGSKPEVVPEENAPPTPHPALGLYLVGWGIPGLLVGLSGAVNPSGYANPHYCSLGPGPGFTPVIVPVGAIAVFIFTRALMVRSAAVEKDSNAQLSEGTQATDLELLETVATPAEHASLHSIATPSSHIEDLEHPPYVQLKAFLIVIALFTMVWALATLSVIQPFHFPYEETLLSIVYALFIVVLGAFVIFFYCFSRSDVRSVWFTLKHIKRSRNITDLQHVTPPILNPRNSISSSVGRKSTSPRPEPQGEASQKTNLIDLHRRQYHNNVINEPNTFYNPHQSIVARKFFKKQRRKQNNLGTRRSGDGATPISQDNAELFLLGSKVNNTNIHVEIPSPQSANVNILHGTRPLERLVIGAERGDSSVKYASVGSDCCSCLVSEAHSITECTRDLTSDHSSRSSHLYATVAPDISPFPSRKYNPQVPINYKNEIVHLKMQEPTYVDIKSSDEDKKETSV